MCVCVCVCVCVAKPVVVELRCHATALIFSFMDSFVFKEQVLLGLTFSLWLWTIEYSAPGWS